MAITKIQSESLNLADDFAFTGTITGAGGGKVLQVVTYQDATQRSTTSTSYVDVTSFQATITPSSTSNKILVMVSSSTGNNGSQETKFNITRNGTGLSSGDGFAYAYTPAGNSYSHNHIHYLDSPSSTSALTYKLQFKVGGNTGYANHGGTQGSMTLMEIAG